MVKKTKDGAEGQTSELDIARGMLGAPVFDPLLAPQPVDAQPTLTRQSSSIDLSSRAGRAALFNAKGTPLTDLGPNGSYIIEVHQWAVIARDLVPDEGPVEKDVPCLILWGGAKDIYAFCNTTIMGRFYELLEMEGNGPWEAPLTVEISSQTPRRGTKTTYSLRYIV